MRFTRILIVGMIAVFYGCKKADQRELDFSTVAGQYQLLYTKYSGFTGNPFHQGGTTSYYVDVADSSGNVKSVIIQPTGVVQFYLGYNKVFEASDFDYEVNSYYHYIEMDIYPPIPFDFGQAGYSPFVVRQNDGRMTRSVSTGSSGTSTYAIEVYKLIHE